MMGFVSLVERGRGKRIENEVGLKRLCRRSNEAMVGGGRIGW